MDSAEDVMRAVRSLSVHREKFSTEQQSKIKSHIRRHAKRIGVTLNLANSTSSSAQGETGKTRTQPRQYGGRFGVKSATEAPQFTPKQVSEAIDNLKPGQSINLPNNAGKVRRLTNGFQIVSPNGQTNIVLPSAQAAATRANSMAKLKGGTK